MKKRIMIVEIRVHKNDKTFIMAQEDFELILECAIEGSKEARIESQMAVEKVQSLASAIIDIINEEKEDEK